MNLFLKPLKPKIERPSSKARVRFVVYVLYMALHLWNFVRRHASFCSECGIVRAGVIRRTKYWIICVLLTIGQALALEFRSLSQECQTLMQPWDAVSRLHKARPPDNRRCQINWTDFLLCVNVTSCCWPIVILWTLVYKQTHRNIPSMGEGGVPQIFQKSRSRPPDSKRLKGTVKQVHCWEHTVLWWAVRLPFPPGTCAQIHILVCMSKNCSNYAENTERHRTKFSRAAGRASGICAPLHSILQTATCKGICHECYRFSKDSVDARCVTFNCVSSVIWCLTGLTHPQNTGQYYSALFWLLCNVLTITDYIMCPDLITVVVLTTEFIFVHKHRVRLRLCSCVQTILHVKSACMRLVQQCVKMRDI
jgi:hypothetical protein